MRKVAGKTDAVETGYKHIAPQAVLVDHTVFLLFCRPESLECPDLPHHRSAKHDILVDLESRIAEIFRGTEIPDPPPGHCVGFGETVKRDGPLPEITYRCCSAMVCLIGQLCIYLVAD